jgi:hypothetical protein
LVGIGGLVTAVGAVLPWATITPRDPELPPRTISGFETTDGKIFLIVGVAAVVLVLIARVLGSAVGRRVLGVVVVIGAGFTLAIGGGDLARLEENYFEPRAERLVDQFPGTPFEEALEALRSLVTIAPEIGLYLVVAGAALAVLGALLLVALPGTDVEPAPRPPESAPPPAARPATGGESPAS